MKFKTSMLKSILCDYSDAYMNGNILIEEVAVMPVYNVIEYSNNYSKSSGSLWQYYRDEPALANGAIVDFPAINKRNASFKSK